MPARKSQVLTPAKLSVTPSLRLVLRNTGRGVNNFAEMNRENITVARRAALKMRDLFCCLRLLLIPRFRKKTPVISLFSPRKTTAFSYQSQYHGVAMMLLPPDCTLYARRKCYWLKAFGCLVVDTITALKSNAEEIGSTKSRGQLL